MKKHIIQINNGNSVFYIKSVDDAKMEYTTLFREAKTYLDGDFSNPEEIHNDDWKCVKFFLGASNIKLIDADTKSFNFWKNNRIDKEYSLTIDEIKERYLKWLKTKDQAWIIYYGNMTVNLFVAGGGCEDKESLSSVTDDSNYEELQNLLMDVRHKYIDGLKSKQSQ